MIWAVALYLRGRPVLAGVVLGGRRLLQGGGAVRAARAGAARARPGRWRRASAAAPDDWRPRPALWRLAIATFTARRRVHRAAGDHGPDRAAVRRRRRPADHRRPVRPPRPHDHLRGAADEPARPAGDRLLPVAVAGRPQADRVPADQPVAAGPGSERDPSGVGVPRHDQPADHAARRCRRWCSRSTGSSARRRRPTVAGASRSALGESPILGRRLVYRHLAAVRAAEPDRPAHQLPLLHGDRDARASTSRSPTWRSGCGGCGAGGASGGQRCGRCRVVAAVVLMYPFVPVF